MKSEEKVIQQLQEDFEKMQDHGWFARVKTRGYLVDESPAQIFPNRIGAFYWNFCFLHIEF